MSADSPEAAPPPDVSPPPHPRRPPTVAIVGRPNVGKSSLLNALTRRRVSIVQDQPGITRDRVSHPLEIDGRWVELVDTGGYGFEDPDDLTDAIREQVEHAIRAAALVLFVVDTKAGLTPADEQIALLLRRLGVQTVLLANKADGPKTDVNLGDFARLGFGTPLGISATTGRNLERIESAVRRGVNLDEAPTALSEPDLHVTIVGKRNAGKSTFVNAVAGLFEGDPQRVIVSQVSGTTRDSVDVRFEKDGRSLVVIDTAGVRKKRHIVNNNVEFYSFHRAQRSVRRADVVLLLIDATQSVSDPDKKLAGYISEQFKPVVLVLNKWDQALAELRRQRGESKMPTSERQLMDEYRTYLRHELPFLAYAPVAFTTAAEGRNVAAVLDTARNLAKQAAERVTTGRLNTAVRAAIAERSPGASAGGRRPKVFYVTQVATSPPTVVLFVNDPANFDESYRRFLVNRFRESLPFREVPIRLLVRARTQTTGVGGIERPKSEGGTSHDGEADANAEASEGPIWA